MNFCSDHVYIYNNSENESITDDDETSSTTSSSLDLSYDLYNCTCSSMKIDSNNNKNGSDANTSSILYDDASHLCNCNYCIKKSSISMSIANNATTSKTSGSSGRNFFYYSSDSAKSEDTRHRTKVKRLPTHASADCSNVSSSDELDYTASSDRKYNNLLNEVTDKLYKQTSLTNVNSVINCSTQSTRSKRRSVKIRKPDTNIIALELNQLVESSTQTHAGDPTFCMRCKAILSNESNLIQLKNTSKKVWICEFCSAENHVALDDNEIPTDNDITFLIEPAKFNVKSIDDESIIVFCIDISGSMNVTKKLDGYVELKSRKNNISQLEFITGEKFDISNCKETYVSRLESLQFAIDQNLEKLKNEYPNRRVVLIAFNDEVIIIGDGTIEPIRVASTQLCNEQEILEYCKLIKNLKPIQQTKSRLEERLYQLEANGSTALGPALLLSIQIAASKENSQVILCTDGLANHGFGNLEENFKYAITFYDELSELALKKGVSVSIITLKGTGCKLSVIGKLPEYTNGYINTVDQLDIKNEIESIIEKNTILASNVEVTLVAHSSVYIQNNEIPNQSMASSLSSMDSVKQSKLVKQIGNVTKNSEITFQYGIKCNEDSLMELKKLTKLPFQLQIQYRAKDGSKALRVITQYKQYTSERKVAENDSSLNLLAKHALTTQAKLASNNLFNGKKFSSVPIRSQLKSVSNYLHSHQYNSKKLDDSFQSLIKAVKSKSKTSHKRAEHAQQNQHHNQATHHSDEESEAIIRLTNLHSSRI